MAKFLRIALWNANGLIKRKEELKIFLQDQLIDIMFISETLFTDKSHFQIPGHKVYHTNHPDNTAHAETAIIIRSTTEHHLLTKYEKDYLQATSVRVKTLAYEITVSAVSCPPRHHNVKKEDFKDFLQHLGPKFIVGGDFNSKHTLWGSRLITNKGRELAEVLHENSYSPLPTGTPTYWPTDPGKVPDLLDFFITSGISKSYMEIQSNLDLSSDHTPVITTISTTIMTAKKISKLHTAKPTGKNTELSAMVK
jgi:exonuclease III